MVDFLEWPYLSRYPGRKTKTALGNSCFKTLFWFESQAITMLKLFCSNSRMIGMQRVVCPSPQSNGATIARCFFVEIGYSLFLTKLV